MLAFLLASRTSKDKGILGGKYKSLFCVSGEFVLPVSEGKHN